jgi:hypothetical protein
MIRALLATLLLAASAMAWSDTYQLTWGWTDPTTYLPSDAPTYEARYRVAAGAIVPLPATATPAGTASVTADPGAPIEVSVRNANGALSSAWSGWVTATAPYPPTQPGEPVGLTITVTRVP